MLRKLRAVRTLRKLVRIVRNKQGLYTYSDYGGKVNLPPELDIGVDLVSKLF